MTTAPRRPRSRSLLAVALAGVLAALGLAVLPAAADTKAQLDEAKRRLSSAQAAADQAAAVLGQAEADLAQTRNEIDATRRQIATLQARISRIGERLQRRAVLAFQEGPASTIDVLLSSRSITEFSDRLEFLGSIAQSDSDLMLEQEVATQQLARKQADLQALSQRQAERAAAFRAAEQRAQEAVAAVQTEVDRLTSRYKHELAASRALQILGQRPQPGASIAVCPVAGPNSFVDSFGWPRPGGRSHEGIDMISPYGTPVAAVQAGNAVATPNSLGGNAVIVYGSGGDWTYYAHLSSYGSLGSVSVGTVIGHVGSTGDTNVNHLHFEYHPGGGAAADPYQALLAVC